MFVTRKAPILIIGFALVVVLGLLWSVGDVWGQEPDSGLANLDVILLIDNSQSMSDTSDPRELRIRTAQRIVDRLSEHAETFDLRHRVGVVSFGIGVTRTIQLKELPNNTVRNGISAEKIPGSDFREPLDIALQQFRDYSFGTGNRKAVILFSDGRPQLTENPLMKEELAAYFSERSEEVLRDGKGNLTDRIRKLEAEGVQIFLVAIADTDEDRSNWTGLSSEIRYLRLDSSTDVDNVADIIVDQLTAVTIPSPTAPTPTVPPTTTPTVTPTPTLLPTLTRSSTLTPTPTLLPTSTPTPTLPPTPTSIVVGPVVMPTPTGTQVTTDEEDLRSQLVAFAVCMALLASVLAVVAWRLCKDKTQFAEELHEEREEKAHLAKELDRERKSKPIDRERRYFGKMIQDLKSQASIPSERLQEIWIELRTHVVAGEVLEAEGFGLVIVRAFAAGDQDLFEDFWRSSVQEDISSMKKGAGLALFTILVRQNEASVFPRIYQFLALGCDRQVFVYAAGSPMEEIETVGLPAPNRKIEDDIRELCLLYSRLLGELDLDASSTRSDLKKMDRFFHEYGAYDSRAFHQTISDSIWTTKGAGVIPFAVRPELENASFSQAPQLRPLANILLRFKGRKLNPLKGSRGIPGFYEELVRAKHSLDEYAFSEQQVTTAKGEVTWTKLPCLPEYLLLKALIAKWVQFSEALLPEESAAELSVRPVTTWVPNNPPSAPIHVAWVLINKGPSFADVDRTTLYLGVRNLARISRPHMLLYGERSLVEFEIDPKSIPGNGELNLVPEVEFSDMKSLQTKRFSDPPDNPPHWSFEVPATVEVDEAILCEFIGRENELKQVSEEMIERAKRILYLWGPPGIGKHSLLEELDRGFEHSLRLDYEIADIVRVDGRHRGSKSPEEMLSKLDEHISDARTAEPPDIVFLVFDDIINGLVTMAHEIEADVDRLSAKVMKMLESVLAKNPALRLVLIGTQAPDDMARLGGELPDQTLALHLGPLAEDELVQYVSRTTLYKHCNQLALLRLLKYSGGYYVFARLLLEGLISYLRDESNWAANQPRYVSCELVPDVVRYVIQSDLGRAEGPIAQAWNKFPPEERAVISALCKGIRQSGEELVSLTEIVFHCKLDDARVVTSTVERLQQQMVFEEQYGRYKLRIGLIAGWLGALEAIESGPATPSTMEIIE